MVVTADLDRGNCTNTLFFGTDAWAMNIQQFSF
jgi:hypothetical protein